jgi:DNA-binding SARP family transcriptional activator/tetratricopeptide (TPR) repeat protein
VLGGFSVEGLEERALGTRKARLLLKKLAVAGGRGVPTDELAAVVWNDEMPRNPADQVSVLVSRLRRVIGSDRLVRTDAGYCLRADWFDVVELEQTVVEIEERLLTGEDAAALAVAQIALSLATGTLLPEEDGEWVDEARPAADRLVARARLLAAEAALRASEYGAARAAAQEVLDYDPYDEAALRLVMRSDALAGRPGAALAAYAAVRHRLSEDLGVDPSPDTETLHTSIVRGELPITPGTSVIAKSVVGRETEFKMLDRALERAAQGEPIAVVIEADPGMGKTTLLSTWVAEVALHALVLSGRCDELGGDLPLQPIADGLASHLQTLGRETAAELLGPEASIVDSLLGRGVASDSAAVTTVRDDKLNRAALFAALVAVLRRLAGTRVMVLTIDDLHQAADGTAEFLTFALHQLPQLMVVAARRNEPGPDLPAAERILPGPLKIADVIALYGQERGPALFERSGGHPLFVRELAATPSGELPPSIVRSVRGQMEALGEAAISLEAAAACGTEVDATLVVVLSGRPMRAVLDDLEKATGLGLLRPRGAALAFNHEMLREAIESATSPPRRREFHRAAVAELAGRSEVDPLVLARHANLSGENEIGASALISASERAAQRFESGSAERLLDQAIELKDSFAARLARGRLRLARLDLESAQTDALRAIELGAGVHGFELAGWTAYYGRDYDTALRYADEGVERAEEDGVRASCLALAGRIRHTRGDLEGANLRFQRGIDVAPPGIRGMLLVWHAQLLVHRGEPERAVDLAHRGLLDPHLAHPFVAGHGYFTRAYAFGMRGEWVAALKAVDDLDDWVARTGDKRFPPVATNMRGWLLRGAGLLEEAIELHLPAVEVAPGPTFQEAHYAALLDLAECHLAVDDLDEASAVMGRAADISEWTGSMSWRHRNRYRLISSRLVALSGSRSDGSIGAHAVAVDSSERGDRRYEQRALLAAVAIDAAAGRPSDPEMLASLVERFVPICGPDGWRDLGVVARATGSSEVWRVAERCAASIVEAASSRPGVDSERVALEVRRQLDRLRP